MASFEEIMNKPASEIKPPPAYPVGTYHCLVDGVPVYGKSSQKQTDQFTVKYKILKAMEDVDATAAAEMQVPGKIIQTEYYITDTAAYRFKEMLIDHLGIDPGPEGKERPLKELMAEAPGKQLLVKLRHELSQDGKRTFHRVDSTAHV